MMTKSIITILVFCLVFSVSGMIKRPLDPYWDNIDNYCGSRLANELQYICRGKYNDVPVREQQLSVEDRRQLQLPVIVDECCTLPCTRRILKMYCAPDN